MTTTSKGKEPSDAAATAGGAVASPGAVPGLGYQPSPVLVRLVPMADGLARALGPNYEIVLHDLRHPDRALCHLAGNVTGRSIGAPVTNVVLEALEAEGDAAEDIYNYRTEIVGRPIRSSIIFIRDGTHIVGAVGLNVDVSGFEMIQEEIDRLIGFDRKQAHRNEVFPNSVVDLVDELLAQTLADAGLRPSNMSAAEKLRVVESLQARGVFHAKGAVERVAETLGVSKFTVYGYLQRLRRDNPGAHPKRAIQPPG